MIIKKFKYNKSFILSRLSFHYEGKFYHFNGMICLNFDGNKINVGFFIKDESWHTSFKTFDFNKIYLIQFRDFSQKIHEEFVSKEYKPCDCGKDSEFTWISGYCGYILCGHCNGKIAY